MRIDLPTGRSVRLQFLYATDKRRTWTFLFIYDRATRALLETGATICSPHDDFIREAGRQIALRRALQPDRAGQSFSREERRAIWTAYWTRKVQVPRVVDSLVTA